MDSAERNELTGPMQRVEQRLGQPLGPWLQARYETDGWTTARIGAALGVSSTTVGRWLDFFGIELRFPGQRGKAIV